MKVIVSLEYLQERLEEAVAGPLGYDYAIATIIDDIAEGIIETKED